METRPALGTSGHRIAAAVTLWAYDWPADERWRRATAGAVAVIALVASLGAAGAWTLATAAEASTGAISSAGAHGLQHRCGPGGERRGLPRWTERSGGTSRWRSGWRGGCPEHDGSVPRHRLRAPRR